MTTETKESPTQEEAMAALTALELIERAIDRAYVPVADSLGADGRKGVDKRIKSLRDEIKVYLEEQGGRLHEGELETTATLQVRTSTPSFDLVTCASTEEGQAALIEAAKAGMVRVDFPMLKRFREQAGATWADTVWRYHMPGGTTSALIIERGAAR